MYHFELLRKLFHKSAFRPIKFQKSFDFQMLFVMEKYLEFVSLSMLNVHVLIRLRLVSALLVHKLRLAKSGFL